MDSIDRADTATDTPVKLNPDGQPILPVDKKRAKLLEFYAPRSTDIYDVYCVSHEDTIALECVMADYKPPKRTHADDAIVVPLNRQLLGFRLRSDGTMGYQCACGADSRLLKEEAELSGGKPLLPHVKHEIDKSIKDRKAGKSKNSELFERRRVQ